MGNPPGNFPALFTFLSVIMATQGSLSHGRALVDWEQSAITKYLNVEKVIPGLISRGVISKKVGRGITKRKELQVKALMGVLKKQPVGGFVAFVETLGETFSQCEDHKTLVNLMSSSIRRIDLPPQSTEVIQTVIRAAIEEKETGPVVEGQAMYQTSPLQLQEVAVHQLAAGTTLTEGSPKMVLEAAGQTSHLEAIATTNESPGMEQLPSSTHSSSNTSSPLPDKSFHKATSSEAAAVLQSTVQLSPVASQSPIHPPSGFIESRSAYYHSRDSVSFYLPESGVSVDIPSQAIPSGIGTHFWLGAFVYLRGPFQVPGGITLCTPIVWFKLHPRFKFKADVVIRIPHSAIIKRSTDLEQFCFLTIPDDHPTGPIYKLSKILPADFTDSYHAVATVRHFSPVSFGIKQKSHHSSESSLRSTRSPLRKLTQKSKEMTPLLKSLSQGSSFGSSQSSFEEQEQCRSTSAFRETPGLLATSQEVPGVPLGQGSNIRGSTLEVGQSLQDNDDEIASTKDRNSSLELSSSFETSESEAVNEYFIARCMPKDRCADMFEATFLVSYCNSLGLKVLHLAARRKLGEGYDLSHRRFQLVDDVLTFEPSEWNDDWWSVFATETNQLDREDILLALDAAAAAGEVEQLPYHLPHLTYAVQATNYPATSPLRCKIEVLGARTHIGQQLFFVLTSTKSTPRSKGAHVLTSNANLYTEDSPIKMAISKQDYSNLQLNLQDADHRKFIVDLSFQLSECERLGHCLRLEEYHIERIQADYSNVTEQAYQLLRTSLSRMPNVTLGQLQCALKGLGVTGLTLRTPLSEEWELSWDSMSINDEEFLRNLGVKLQYRWKFMGRLLELQEHDLNGIERCNHEDLGEQSYQMLLRWRKQQGNRATYGQLLTAIQSVFDHDSANVWEAWVYAIKYLQNKHQPAA